MYSIDLFFCIFIDSPGKSQNDQESIQKKRHQTKNKPVKKDRVLFIFIGTKVVI